MRGGGAGEDCVLTESEGVCVESEGLQRREGAAKDGVQSQVRMCRSKEVPGREGEGGGYCRCWLNGGEEEAWDGRSGGRGGRRRRIEDGHWA